MFGACGIVAHELICLHIFNKRSHLYNILHCSVAELYKRLRDTREKVLENNIIIVLCMTIKILKNWTGLQPLISDKQGRVWQLYSYNTFYDRFTTCALH